MHKPTVLLVSVTMIMSISCKQEAPKRNVVARVGDEALSLQEVIADIPPQIQANLTSLDIRQYVLRWMNNEVLYQEALRRELDESEEMRHEFERLKRELLVNKLLQLALDHEIAVTDDEIEQYFETNQEEFALTEDRVRAHHICVRSRKEANAVRARLRRGEAFEEIVASAGDDSLASDWDLGYFSEDEIIPELSKAVFALRPGRYSQPIQSPYGYHVVKVIEKKKKGELMTLDMVKEEIRLKLQEQKRQKNYQRFLSQIKTSVDISTNFRLLDGAAVDSLIEERIEP